ncbi:MAG: glycosyltransferase [Chitinivibrionales bacterium]|nr:glycosyltransferase [Chitinivibrionales bacterium]
MRRYSAGTGFMCSRSFALYPKRRLAGNAMTKSRELAVILPVYNSERFIADSVIRLHEYLASISQNFEVVVVNDGSTDHSLDELSKLNGATCRIISSAHNQGKGGAVSLGMQQSNARCKMFLDADLPFELSIIRYARNLILDYRYHIVIGDRTLPESTYVRMVNPVRKLTYRLFPHFIRLLVTGGLFDTQCGFKAFRSDIADALFPLLTCRNFAFDVELLYIALKYNMSIRRIPVRFTSTNESTVHPFVNGLQMIRAIAGLRKHWRRGDYTSSPLTKICSTGYWQQG